MLVFVCIYRKNPLRKTHSKNVLMHRYNISDLQLPLKSAKITNFSLYVKPQAMYITDFVHLN